MKLRNRIATLVVATSLLAGCQTNAGSNEQSGVVIGAVLGGILGKEVSGRSGRTSAIILGTLIGSQIGGNIGRSMDETDRLKVAHSLETVRTGVSTTWTNPDTNYSYAITPTSTTESSSGPCREYTIDAMIGGKTEQIYGTACRQPDGSWKTVS